MIASIGDVLLDVFLLSILRNEEQGSGVVLRPGGSAANTAAWIAHLHSSVTFFGCVGDDSVGAMLVDDLTRAGVVCRVRTVAEAETGAVAIEVSAEGERTMRSSRGANEDLSPLDIIQGLEIGLSWVHLTGYALLDSHGLALLDAAAEIARHHGAPLSFDPSSTGVVGRFGPETMMEAVRTASVQVLLPNADEALALSGEPDLNRASTTLTRVAPTVIIKDGWNGALVCEGEKSRRLATNRVTPVDTTGAGDAFNAGIIKALCDGVGAQEACAVGHSVARQVLDHYGGRPPSRLAEA